MRIILSIGGMPFAAQEREKTLSRLPFIFAEGNHGGIMKGKIADICAETVFQQTEKPYFPLLSGEKEGMSRLREQIVMNAILSAKAQGTCNYHVFRSLFC